MTEAFWVSEIALPVSSHSGVVVVGLLITATGVCWMGPQHRKGPPEGSSPKFPSNLDLVLSEFCTIYSQVSYSACFA